MRARGGNPKALKKHIRNAEVVTILYLSWLRRVAHLGLTNTIIECPLARFFRSAHHLLFTAAILLHASALIRPRPRFL